MKIQSLILYGSATKLSKAHYRVTRRGSNRFPTPFYFVRAQVFNGDVDEALEKAKPLTDEVVLNTVPLYE